MNNINNHAGGPTAWKSAAMQKRIKRRYARERRFRLMGLAALSVAAIFLVALLGNITSTGIGGFFQTRVQLTVTLEERLFGQLEGLTEEEQTSIILRADYGASIREALMQEFPDVRGRRDIRRLAGIVSSGARSQLADKVLKDRSLIGQTITLWVPTSDDIDMYVKGNVLRETPEGDRRVSNQEMDWIDNLQEQGRIETGLNTAFLTNGDSREPEIAGIWGAIVGSALTLTITLLFAFPIGVMAAIYLEEFASHNRLTDLIEVNINNLAAVPSIVYGLLGLGILLGVMNMPRSAPLVGGLTLALMTLPTIIIAGRAAIKAVPPSIRDAATGLGASKMQVTFHHVLPLALPGVLTGAIIGMARALGETAPLLMIGMVAFIVDIPTGFTDASTVLPVQIYIWADSPERAFVEKTSAAIMVLLLFLIAMNGVAIWLRNKFEQRW